MRSIPWNSQNHDNILTWNVTKSIDETHEREKLSKKYSFRFKI